MCCAFAAAHGWLLSTIWHPPGVRDSRHPAVAIASVHVMGCVRCAAAPPGTAGGAPPGWGGMAGHRGACGSNAPSRPGGGTASGAGRPGVTATTGAGDFPAAFVPRLSRLLATHLH